MSRPATSTSSHCRHRRRTRPCRSVTARCPLRVEPRRTTAPRPSRLVARCVGSEPSAMTPERARPWPCPRSSVAAARCERWSRIPRPQRSLSPQLGLRDGQLLLDAQRIEDCQVSPATTRSPVRTNTRSSTPSTLGAISVSWAGAITAGQPASASANPTVNARKCSATSAPHHDHRRQFLLGRCSDETAVIVTASQQLVMIADIDHAPLLASVDLPEPERPTIATQSPGWIRWRLEPQPCLSSSEAISASGSARSGVRDTNTPARSRRMKVPRPSRGASTSSTRTSAPANERV
jgi:hypothetical protein